MKTNRAERWYTVTDEKAGSAGAHTNTNNALLIHSAGGGNKACHCVTAFMSIMRIREAFE